MKRSIIRYRFCFLLTVLALLVTMSPVAQAANAGSPSGSIQAATTAQCYMDPPSYSFRGTSQNVVIDGEFRYFCGKWQYTSGARVFDSWCYYFGDYEARLTSSTVPSRQTVYQDITVPATVPSGSETLGILIFFKEVPADASLYDSVKVSITDLDTGVKEVVVDARPFQGGYRSCTPASFPVQKDYRGKRIRLTIYSTFYATGYDARIDSVSLWFNSWL